MFNSKRGLPHPNPNFIQPTDLLFIGLPCSFSTQNDTASLSDNGMVDSGTDWALLRGDDYVMISSSRLTVDSGDVLWHIRDGVTIAGGYHKDSPKRSMSPGLAALMGAVAASIGAVVINSEEKEF